MTDTSTATTSAEFDRVMSRVVLAGSDGLIRPAGGEHLIRGVGVDAIHPSGDGLWALTDRRTLHHIEQGAVRSVASLGAADRATCVTVHRGEVWVAGATARLWRLDGETLAGIETFDDAPTHDDWHTPWGGPPDVFSMASDGDALFVNVHVGGILRTDDDGVVWSPTIDLHVDAHQVVVDRSGGVWAATGMRALAHSTDRGASWRFHDDGLHATYALAVAVTDDAVLVGTSSGHAATDGALYRFDGSSFARCVAGLPSELAGAVSPRHLVADGADAAVALPDGSVYVSADGGRTWTLGAIAPGDLAEIALIPRSASG